LKAFSDIFKHFKFLKAFIKTNHDKGSIAGVANLFGARAKLLGKRLQRVYYTLKAKISESQYLLFYPTVYLNNI
jgi:hypothetical protein